MAFEQAGIKVENQAEFEELKGAVERAFEPERVERFLKLVSKSGARVRELEKVLAARCLERIDQALKRSEKRGKALYQALPVSDQAQIREFYLFQVEKVSPELRARFQKIYQYY